MEIDHSRIAPSLTVVNEQGASVQKGSKDQGGNAPSHTTSSGGNNTADQVSLTHEARLLQSLEVNATKQPVVDSERVNAIRHTIENGSFKINPERIAEKMISLEQALANVR